MLGILKSVHSNVDEGLPDDLDDIEERRRIFGINEVWESSSLVYLNVFYGILFVTFQLPLPPAVTWMDLFLESFEDTTLIVLIVSAVVSLVIGIWEDPRKGWIEGAAILVAVIIVAVVTATNNYSKEVCFNAHALIHHTKLMILCHGLGSIQEAQCCQRRHQCISYPGWKGC